MPKITAILHTHNDEQRIGRALDSLRAIDEILVIDHGSTDDTVKIANHHGAHVKKAVPGVNPGVYAVDARHDWVFSLLPNEAVGDALEAALLEWKDRKDGELNHSSFSAAVREETDAGWHILPSETRLVNRTLINWSEALPVSDPASALLAGEILRFNNP